MRTAEAFYRDSLRIAGSDGWPLSIPVPQFGFPGLRNRDAKWRICPKTAHTNRSCHDLALYALTLVFHFA